MRTEVSTFLAEGAWTVDGRMPLMRRMMETV